MLKNESGILSAGNGVYELGYQLFLPKEVSGELPLIVFLHGSGERGDGREQLEKVCIIALPRYCREGSLELPAAVLCPQCPENLIWNNITVALKALIDRIVTEYPIDPHRVSLTGLSMGGYGVWEMGICYPNYFSALAPICGGGVSWRASLLKDTPIWAFHGDADRSVPVENSIDMVDAVNRSGGSAKLSILHGVGHNSWDPAYLETRLIDWLLEQRREEPTD